MSNYQSNDYLEKIKGELEVVKQNTAKNIDIIIERGEKISTLEEKTHDLNENSKI